MGKPQSISLDPIKPLVMDRRDFIKKAALLAPVIGALPYLLSIPGASAAEMEEACTGAPQKIMKTEEEWKKILSAEEFRVLRKKGTERPFTGALLHNKKQGIYRCAACDLPLFGSDGKYESGTGWPSFWKPLCPDNVEEESDNNLKKIRREVLCARCGGHLGHVFKSGPPPTGLRYCINSVSLSFEDDSQKMQ